MPDGAMRNLTIRVRALKRSEKLMMLIIINIVSIRRRYKTTTFIGVDRGRKIPLKYAYKGKILNHKKGQR